MSIQVLHKPTGQTGILSSSSYFSHAAGRRITLAPTRVVDFIGRIDPPCKMMMKLQLSENPRGVINCQPKDLVHIDHSTIKPSTTRCKSIW